MLWVSTAASQGSILFISPPSLHRQLVPLIISNLNIEGYSQPGGLFLSLFNKKKLNDHLNTCVISAKLKLFNSYTKTIPIFKLIRRSLTSIVPSDY